jgi:membrane fusion protein, multidrug efflux system
MMMIHRSEFGRLLLAGVVAVVAGCGGPEVEGSEEADALAVGPESVVIVKHDGISTGPIISGTLETERSATVRAEIGGSVLGTFAEEGQPVGAGQLLARIDDAAVQDALLSAQSGLRSAENSVEIAEREASRAERLAAGGAIATRDAELALNQLSTAHAQLADAVARLSQAQKQLDATRVRSPLDGAVSERAVNAGDVVAPGAALFTVIDPSRMRLEAAVPSEQLGSLSVGTPVEFEVRGYPGVVFRGTIERINPAADPATRQVPIYVSVPNVGNRLVAGLFAEGQVERESRDALIIPMSALDETDAAPTVLRLRGGLTERVNVQLGVRDPETERVEIVAGLAAGDTLLTGAARTITPGTPVRIGVLSPAVPTSEE